MTPTALPLSSHPLPTEAVFGLRSPAPAPADLLNLIRKDVDGLISSYREQIAGRPLSISGVVAVLTVAAGDVAGLLAAAGGSFANVDKRAACVAAVMEVYKILIEPTSAVPAFLEPEIPIIVNGIIDAIVNLFKAKSVDGFAPAAR